MEEIDSVRTNALARRDAALAEAKRWDDFLRLYDELKGGTGPTGPLAQQVKGVSAGGLRGTTGKRVLVTENCARSIIATKGRPVPTRELLDEMTAQGFVIGGKNPLATLNTRLGRAPSLEYVRPHGWRLKVEPSQKEGAGGSPSPKEEHPAPDATTNDAVRRGEVAHDNMT